jgi:hypothetical protein
MVGLIGFFVGLAAMLDCSATDDPSTDYHPKASGGSGGTLSTGGPTGSAGNQGGTFGATGGSTIGTGSGGASGAAGAPGTGAAGTQGTGSGGGSTGGGAGGKGGAMGSGGSVAGSGNGGRSGTGGAGGSGSGGKGGSNQGGTGGSGVDAGPNTGVWRPAPGTTWQWQLTGTIDTSVDAAMYDIDLFDAPQATIDQLHGAGRIVICYFSAGTFEDWRTDAGSFPAAALGNGVDGWPGEKWLDTRNATVRQILSKRLDLAVQKHCDGVEPDNVDGYTNNPGFPLTAATQLDYNRFFAGEAHTRSLSVGLKNDLDQVADLEPSFDWALNEECSKYSECDMLAQFTKSHKAVFHAEYGSSCPAAVTGFSTILKHLQLDAFRTVCP